MGYELNEFNKKPGTKFVKFVTENENYFIVII